MAYRNEARALFNKGKEAKSKKKAAEKKIESLEKRLDRLYEADTESESSNAAAIARCEREIAKQEALIDRNEKIIQAAIDKLQKLAAKVKKDAQKFAKAAREAMNAAQQITSRDNSRASHDMREAAHTAKRKVQELRNILKEINGYIRKLRGEGGFEAADNFDLGPGIAREISPLGGILERVRAPGAGDRYDADHINYEVRADNIPKPLSNTHIPLSNEDEKFVCSGNSGNTLNDYLNISKQVGIHKTIRNEFGEEESELEKISREKESAIEIENAVDKAANAKPLSIDDIAITPDNGNRLKNYIIPNLLNQPQYQNFRQIEAKAAKERQEHEEAMSRQYYYQKNSAKNSGNIYKNYTIEKSDYSPFRGIDYDPIRKYDL